jgi:hypothetical protein
MYFSGAFKMKTITKAMALLALFAILGCSESTSRKDVASARDKLQKEQQRTTETMHEGQRDIADAQQRAQEHTVAKPVTTDATTTREEKRLADAQLTAEQKIAKQKEKEREAAANLADKEQQFQATQARDAYVKDVDIKLADADKQIDLLKQKASNAQGADKDALNRQVDMLKTQRDMAKKAFNDLKGADLATWKNHQEHVRVALQDLENNMRNIR